MAQNDVSVKIAVNCDVTGPKREKERKREREGEEKREMVRKREK